MPRLIPRLLTILRHSRNHSPNPPLRKTEKLKHVARSSNRVFIRPEEVDISPSGRTQSILLDRSTVRLIFRHSRYQREKSLAPTVCVSWTQWRAKQRSGRVPPGTIPREMSQEERAIFANPYLRLLGSPLRKCYETGWVLPRDLMIRMAPSIVLGDTTQTAYLPSGIEHAAFRRFRGGKSNYLLCWKPVLEHTMKAGGFRRFKPQFYPELKMHPLIIEQISHALRVRVLHELHLLAKQLRRVQQPSSPPLVRRLTRAQWMEIKSNGAVPFKNAVAVLVVPPLNRDPETRLRPVPNYSSIPVEHDRLDSSNLPLCDMYPTAREPWELVDEECVLPSRRVPVYNGVPLFPSRTQRAALFAALNEILRAESLARRRRVDEQKQEKMGHAKGDQKASHAILICSDEQTLLRGDTVPLAIALWRIRMWEQGLEGGSKFQGSPNWTAVPLRTSVN